CAHRRDRVAECCPIVSLCASTMVGRWRRVGTLGDHLQRRGCCHYIKQLQRHAERLLADDDYFLPCRRCFWRSFAAQRGSSKARHWLASSLGHRSARDHHFLCLPACFLPPCQHRALERNARALLHDHAVNARRVPGHRVLVSRLAVRVSGSSAAAVSPVGVLCPLRVYISVFARLICLALAPSSGSLRFRSSSGISAGYRPGLAARRREHSSSGETRATSGNALGSTVSVADADFRDHLGIADINTVLASSLYHGDRVAHLLRGTPVCHAALPRCYCARAFGSRREVLQGFQIEPGGNGHHPFVGWQIHRRE